MSLSPDLYRRALAIRLFEEALLDLFAQNRLHGTVHTCIGQELVALAVGDALAAGDWVFSNHRCHGHYLARTGDARGLLAEIMGRTSGICSGRGGSQHICRGRFFSNGIQGGGVPIAAGAALAASFGLTPASSSSDVSVAFIGDGTLGQGVVYETLNLAARWSAPWLLVLEHNGYAQSTDTTTTIAGSVRARFEAFGVRTFSGDIWDHTALFATARDALAHVRTARAPAVLIAGCYRLKAHSKGDDNRAPEEVAAALARDPLEQFARAQPALAATLRAEEAARLATVLRHIEEESTALAKSGHVSTPDQPAAPALPPPDAAPSYPTQIAASPWQPVAASPVPGARVVERLRTGLADLLDRDPAVLLLGEDIEDPYGGAFKVTRGLSARFPGRVRNTPISEAAIVGFGSGLAMAGRRPIVEIMFGDFLTLAADQLINQASKFAYLYNDQVRVPLLVRTPMGGRRGYGATHSQSLEKHFLGTPGLQIVALNEILDPAELLRRVHAHSHEPCLLLENKLLYGAKVRTTSSLGLPWEQNDEPFPTLRLAIGGGGDATLVAYGGMVEAAEKAASDAFLEDDVRVELLAPTRLHPLDLSPILASVRRTGRLLVVEEGQGFAGFGAEVIAACSERLAGAPLRAARVSAAPHPIPCARDQERLALPQAADLLGSLRRLLSQP